MDEFQTIARIKSRLGRPHPRVKLGIGDDAAVISSSSQPLLFCSDAMVENVHFDLRYTSARDLGHKALAQCLSDIAAMNGTPLAALVSLALPQTTSEKFVDEFYEGASRLVRQFGCDIVGGDLTSSPAGLFIDVTCLGEAKTWRARGGAKVGDLIAVSGHPGAAAAGLAALRAQLAATTETTWVPLIKAQLTPMPRFDLLPSLNQIETLCTSMIDISDGLSSELHHLAEASGLGFEIEATKVPLHPLAIRLALTLPPSISQPALDWALSGGEDYELLVTLDASQFKQNAGSIDFLNGFTVIGCVTEEKGVWIKNSAGLRTTLCATGFRHFHSK